MLLMQREHGGLQIAGGSTAVRLSIGGGPALFTQDWAAISAGRHGRLGVVEAAATGKLTLRPGAWLVAYKLSLETEDESSLSSDSASDSSQSGVSSSSSSSSSPLADVDSIVAQIFRGGTAQAGTKAKISALFADRPAILAGMGIIEITDDHVSAGTNYVQLYLAGGETVTVREGQLFAIQLN